MITQQRGLTILEILITTAILAALTASITAVYLGVFRSVDNSQELSNTRNKLAQGMALLVDESQLNTYGVTTCTSTNLTFNYTTYGYSLYTANGTTKLLRAMPTDAAGSGQVVATNIDSGSSTLCTMGSGGLTTYDLTATTYGSTTRLSNSVQHAGLYPFAASGFPKPVAWWKMDEGTGTTTADSSGNGHTATLGDGLGGATAPTWTTGVSGNGLLFTSASRQYLSISAITPAAGSSYTFNAWLKPAGAPGWFQAIFASDISATLNKNGLYFSNSVTTLGVCVAGTCSTASTGITMVAGSWYMITWVVDTANGTVNVYKNGVFIFPMNATFTPAFNTIGWDRLAAGDNFWGTMDEITYYDQALSAAQVIELFRQTGNKLGGCAPGYSYCTISSACKAINQSDSFNCASCGNACTASSCSSGKCCAAATPDSCPSGCKNLQTDNSNCGYCSLACGGGTPNCVAGVCT